MKLIFFSAAFFCLLLFTNKVAAQKEDDQLSNVESKYYNEVVPSDFDIVFKKDDDKKNFKKLREYLEEKQDFYQELKQIQENFKEDNSSLSLLERKIKKLHDLTIGSNDSVIIIDKSLLYGSSVTYNDKGNTVIEVKQAISDLENNLSDMRYDSTQSKNLAQNIVIVKHDIFTTQNQIDTALAPEYKQQEFRITISICFSLLIGVLLVVFFYIVYKKSDNNLSRELLSGYGLQFITLFVLIIAIILFGILNILGSSELAAILSGISGYILGKGIQKDETKIVQGAAKPNDIVITK